MNALSSTKLSLEDFTITQFNTNEHNFDASLLENLELENAFWRFSIKLWEDGRLRSLMLRLQDEQGLRVNLLLFAVWLSTEDKMLAGHFEDVKIYTKEWHEAVVAPLRRVRKCLPDSERTASLKSQIQQCELYSEQLEQALLFTFSGKIPKMSYLDSPLAQKLTHNLLASQIPQSELLLLVDTCVIALNALH